MTGGPDGVHVGNFTRERGDGLDRLGCWVAEATGRWAALLLFSISSNRNKREKSTEGLEGFVRDMKISSGFWNYSQFDKIELGIF